MYFWNIKKLKKDLKKGLSQKQQFSYLIASTIILSLTMTPWGEPGIWDVYLSLVISAITILGTVKMYVINGGSKGKDFLPRLISLGWVVSIRWAVLVLLPLSILFSVLVVELLGVPEELGVIDISFIGLLYIVFYWMLGKHLKEVAA